MLYSIISMQVLFQTTKRREGEKVGQVRCGPGDEEKPVQTSQNCKDKWVNDGTLPVSVYL